MRILYSLFIVFFLSISVTSLFAQDFSNKGKDFWIPYPDHIDGTGSRMALYISSDENTTGEVRLAGSIIPFTVIANQAISIPIYPTTYAVINQQTQGTNTLRGINVVSVKPVVVFSHVLNAARSASTLVLPTHTLGRKYITISYTQNPSNYATKQISQFQVVGVLDNTQVLITPTQWDITNTRAPNVTFPITLNKGDVYQFQSLLDLTGSKIESTFGAGGSCKPIAVFSGSTFTRIAPTGDNCGGTGDNLFQQLFPSSSWGKNYITAPYTRGFTSPNRLSDIFRIMVDDPTTVVTLNGTPLNPATLINNTYYEIKNSTPNEIIADKSISVVQFMTTQGCGFSTDGDPEMTILNPIEQTIKDITVVSARNNLTPPNTNITKHFFNIIIKSIAAPSLRIDNLVPTGSFIPIAGTNYVYLQEDVTASTLISPSHRINADSGFLAIAYGVGNVESYAYNAGTNVKDLFQQIGVQTQYGIETTPSVCTNSPFKFKVSLPYIPDSMIWNFNNAPNMLPNNNNVFIDNTGNIAMDSSTVVNGRTIYWYSLPTQYIFTASGSYPILISTYAPNTDCGTLQEINFDLIVNEPPIADFNWVTGGCFTEPVQFTETTPQTPKPTYSFWWDFGDPASGAANNSNLRNPQHTFTAPGPYTVKFVSITTPGCFTDTVSKAIVVNPLPSATISGTTSVCINSTPLPVITFTGTGGTSPYTFTYNINGGAPLIVSSVGVATTATVSAPTNIAGTFIYTLETIRNTGSTLCTQNISGQTATVTVMPDHTITLSSAPSTTSQTVCINTPIVPITYTLGGGATGGMVSGLPPGVSSSVTGNTLTITGSPSSTAGSPYNYSITTTGNNCITVSSVGTITVTPDHTISLSSAPSTTNQSVCMNSPITPITYVLGGGATGGNVIGLPAGITSSVTGNVLTISGAPTTTAGSPFNYTITTTGNNCITSSLGGTITVYNLPTVDFISSTPSCETGLISFTDQSTANSGVLTAWSWNFGDGGTSILQNPTHVYATAGTYTVTLTVTSNLGCSNAIPFAKTITINSRPNAGYIVPAVCLSDTYAQFLDTSSVAAPDIVTTWLWNFGDPPSGPLNTSTLQNPQHSYTAVGLYNVQLIVTTDKGCKDTIMHVLSVNGSFPVADFTINSPANLCANDSVAIVEASTVFPGIITKIEIYWDNVGSPGVFDTDNVPYSGKVYKHLYPNFQAPLTRTFTIRYRAYSGGVCVNDKFQNITVNAAPLVRFNAMPNICYDAAPYQITPAIASEIGGVPGNGVFTGTGVSLTGLFTPSVAGPGTHRILYTFTSTAGGCVDTASNTITVWDTASAQIEIQPLVCEKKAISFNSTGSTIPAGNGSITGWSWNFGDPASGAANTSSIENPTHLFTGWGNYNVTLSVTTSNGCRSTFRTLPVFVNPEPKSNFSIPANACLPNANATFTNLSTIADGTLPSLTYYWDFGDPGSGPVNNSTAVNPSHTYITTGPFNVNLQVTSGAGCFHDTTIVINTIRSQPLASFITNRTEACLGSSIMFTDNSNQMGGIANQWNWTMDDGSTRSISSFNHTFSLPGTYNVSLYTVNSFGCRSTTYISPITIHPYPTVDAGPDRLVLEGGQIVLQPTVTGTNLSFNWTPNQYFSGSSTILNPTVNGVDDITYTLTVTGIGGCAIADQVFIKVLKYPAIPNIFSPNGDGTNDTWVIQYLDTYPGSTVEIFNRFGQKIYHSVEYKKPWDGTINGKPVPVGTYYYIVNPKNGRKIMSGYVDVIR